MLAVYNFVYFVAMIVICADAHWARGTKANPLYINFNQMPYIGLWYRCIVFYAGQDQSGCSRSQKTTNSEIEFPNFHKSVLNASASLLLALPYDVKMKVFGFPAGGRITSTCTFSRIIKQPFKFLAYFV